MHAASERIPDSPPPANAAGAAPKLQIRDLQHTYANGVQALAGVTLDVPHGMYGLLGPNGAGKSTLMRIVATLQEPTFGTVWFNGADTIADPFAMRRVLGYLPQEFGVYRGVSAEDLLDHLAVLKGVGPAALRREQVHALLQQTNLFEARKRAVSTYSGGMRQRFGIAQALLGNPQIIIVDEPTAGLDPTERHRFQELLSEIGASVVVILSTHLLDDVSRLCARAAILFGGRVVAEGELSSLVATLHGRIWRKAVQRSEVDAHRRDFNVISSRYVDGHSMLHVLSDDNPGDGFEPVRGDLQDVYFAMTAEADKAGA
jgi:ABC-2 type transport system ATP-binding protein